ncbi:MAG: sigma-54-dependent Fis family transcriptional regulator, partial [Candidatus Marinimicrobia bacterium]|nr:sigma-54-dependent Fis family transcriptional regulator [Candidatus Neomarinimicrobiota bacterium]
MKGKILFVDDDKGSRIIIPNLLSEAGFQVTACESGDEAIIEFEKENYDLVLTDIRMPGLDGMSLLKSLKQKYPELIVVMITAFASIDSTVQAIKEGAEDYITKPYTEEDLIRRLEIVIEKKRILDENKRLQLELSAKYQMGNIIGVSSGMKDVYAWIERASKNNLNVAIYGETGTGKELVARAIHFTGGRADKKFVTVNCGSIPETLLESELFGYAKGAFTGATKDKIGLFESADQGTLFLDEIGDISKNVQVKLLRALEEGFIRRVGETKNRRVDIRIITATNKDLGSMIKEGSFREDLFYRLHVIPIYLPPLRLRKGDISLLIDHFLKKCGSEAGKTVNGFTSKAVDYLLSYFWPGNVRELENV